MAAITLTEAGETFGVGFINDLFLTFYYGGNVTNITSTSAEASWTYQPDEFDPTTQTATVLLNGVNLNAGGTVNSITFQIEGVALFTITGVSFNFAELEDAINDSDIGDVIDIFEGTPLTGNFKNATGDLFMFGLGGKDTLTFGSGNDTFYADGGKDTIKMGAGNDMVYLGNNYGFAAGGKATIDGGAGKQDYVMMSDFETDFFSKGQKVKMSDLDFKLDGYRVVLKNFEGLVGTNFGDTIVGTKKNDIIAGADGNNVITGGKGADLLSGGSGKDRYVYLGEKDSTLNKFDLIGGFEHNRDRIDLSKIDPDTANDKFRFIGEGDLKRAGDVAYRHIEGDEGDFDDRTVISINIDKKGGPDMEIRLSGLVDLTAADFIL